MGARTTKEAEMQMIQENSQLIIDLSMRSWQQNSVPGIRMNPPPPLSPSAPQRPSEMMATSSQQSPR